MASRSEIACRSVKDGVEFFWTPGALTAAMSWAVSHAMSPLAASWWYVPRRTERRLATVVGLHAGLEERPLVALHVVGRDVKRVNPLRLHVPHEVHEIAAVGLDRVVREQHVAEPGHERRGRARGVAFGGRESPGQEGLDLLGRRTVSLQEGSSPNRVGRKSPVRASKPLDF